MRVFVGLLIGATLGVMIALMLEPRDEPREEEEWDIVDEDRHDQLEKEIDRQLHHVAWAPRVNVSATRIPPGTSARFRES